LLGPLHSAQPHCDDRTFRLRGSRRIRHAQVVLNRREVGRAVRRDADVDAVDVQCEARGLVADEFFTVQEGV
jgi:hypothetical protein